MVDIGAWGVHSSTMKTQFNIPPHVINALRVAAKADRRSMTAYLTVLLERELGCAPPTLLMPTLSATSTPTPTSRDSVDDDLERELDELASLPASVKPPRREEYDDTEYLRARAERKAAIHGPAKK